MGAGRPWQADLVLEPPLPDRRPAILLAHGDERIDEWYWLRDREDPAVLDHLRAENAYAEARLAHLAPLRQTLYDEMVARIEETDLSVPVRRGPWWYYQRTEEHKNYPIHCRRPSTGDEPPVGDGPSADEQVILDENALAEGLEFFEVANLAVSPDHRWLAYATDTTGGEIFDLAFGSLGDGTAWHGRRTTPPSFTPGSTTPCGRTSSGGTDWATIPRTTRWS